jgi:hypothetical protein
MDALAIDFQILFAGPRPLDRDILAVTGNPVGAGTVPAR